MLYELTSYTVGKPPVQTAWLAGQPSTSTRVSQSVHTLPRSHFSSSRSSRVNFVSHTPTNPRGSAQLSSPKHNSTIADHYFRVDYQLLLYALQSLTTALILSSLPFAVPLSLSFFPVFSSLHFLLRVPLSSLISSASISPSSLTLLYSHPHTHTHTHRQTNSPSPGIPPLPPTQKR